MSAPTPGRGTPSSRGNRGGKASSYARTKANNLKYGTPLPIVLPASPLHPAYVEPPVPEFVLARRRAQAKERGEPLQEEKSAVIPSPIAFMVQLLSKLSAPTTTKEPVVPVCRGTYDPLTRSVFVTTTDDRNILFDRGFFGKGNLSRSEASWKTRRVKLLQEIAGLAAAGGKRDGKKTAEEVTAERRRERKQFKIDRAQAILNASLAAEAILRSSIQQQGDGATEAFDESASLHRVESTRSNNTSADVAQGVNGTQPDILVPGVQDYAHVLPEGVTRLTPQTFLQRPTRPDSKPKGRKPQSHPPTPPPPPTVATSDVPQNPTTLPESQAVTAISREEEQSASPMVPSGEDLVDPESVEDLEHLQLNLEEAFFLSWALGCLEVVDPKTSRVMLPYDLFQHILSLPQAFKPPPPSSTYMASLHLRRPDNPFLISYIAYHHYRSLGWVVKTGIKFCVDWLLYKKGMVFSHAEFALLVIPHHQDSQDAKSCPFALNNEQPMSWQWLNTVNRVNTQVKKTLILCYVTIPPVASVTEEDWLRPERLLSRYSVREVTIRRFVPARMRD